MINWKHPPVHWQLAVEKHHFEEFNHGSQRTNFQSHVRLQEGNLSEFDLLWPIYLMMYSKQVVCCPWVFPFWGARRLDGSFHRETKEQRAGRCKRWCLQRKYQEITIRKPIAGRNCFSIVFSAGFGDKRLPTAQKSMRTTYGWCRCDPEVYTWGLCSALIVCHTWFSSEFCFKPSSPQSALKSKRYQCNYKES